MLSKEECQLIEQIAEQLWDRLYSLGITIDDSQLKAHAITEAFIHKAYLTGKKNAGNQ